MLYLKYNDETCTQSYINYSIAYLLTRSMIASTRQICFRIDIGIGIRVQIQDMISIRRHCNGISWHTASTYIKQARWDGNGHELSHISLALALHCIVFRVFVVPGWCIILTYVCRPMMRESEVLDS